MMFDFRLTVENADVINVLRYKCAIGDRGGGGGCLVRQTPEYEPPYVTGCRIERVTYNLKSIDMNSLMAVLSWVLNGFRMCDDQAW